VPDGPLADFFRRPLDTLRAGGGEPLTLRLAGPGLPAPVRAGEDRAAVVLLVPEHPQTGLMWEEPGAITAGLAWDCWTWLSSPGELRTDAVPDDVWRDDPPPPAAGGLFRPDGRIFLDGLAGRSEPWSRKVRERFGRFPYF
jgi:hypothetical protein